MSSKLVQTRSSKDTSSDFKLRLPFDNLTRDDMRLLLPKLDTANKDSIKIEKHRLPDGSVKVTYSVVKNPNLEPKQQTQEVDSPVKKPNPSSESFRESKESKNSQSTFVASQREIGSGRASKGLKPGSKRNKVEKANRMLSDIASRVSSRLRSRHQDVGKKQTIMRAKRVGKTPSVRSKELASPRSERASPILKSSDKDKSKSRKGATERKSKLFEESSFEQSGSYEQDFSKVARGVFGVRKETKDTKETRERPAVSRSPQPASGDLYSSIQEKVLALSVVYALDPKVIIRRWLDLGSFEELLLEVGRDFQQSLS